MWKLDLIAVMNKYFFFKVDLVDDQSVSQISLTHKNKVKNKFLQFEFFID